jgi:hypothetical protein
MKELTKVQTITLKLMLINQGTDDEFRCGERQVEPSTLWALGRRRLVRKRDPKKKHCGYILTPAGIEIAEKIAARTDGSTDKS